MSDSLYPAIYKETLHVIRHAAKRPVELDVIRNVEQQQRLKPLWDFVFSFMLFVMTPSFHFFYLMIGIFELTQKYSYCQDSIHSQ